MMEQQVDFSVVLDKIIKTDELLQIHLKATNELQKLQSLYLLLKGENQKLKVKNETLTYNLEQSVKLNKQFNEENDQLKKEVNKLESELSEVVNNLEIKYQTVSLELRESEEKLKLYEAKNDNLNLCESPKKKACRGRKKKETAHIDNKLEEDKIRLEEENRDFKQELVDVKTQLENNEFRYKNELASLQKELTKANQLEKLSISKSLKTCGSQTEKVEIRFTPSNENITNKEKELVAEKKINIQLRSEIENLKKDLANSIKSKQNYELQFEQTDLELNGNSTIDLNLPTINCEEEFNKTSVVVSGHIEMHEKATSREILAKTPLDEEITRIFREQTHPLVLSPIKERTKLRTPRRCSPLLIRPSTSQIPSASGDFIVTTSIPKNQKRISNKIQKKPKNIKTKRNSKAIDILGTLQALKNADINFTISNESILGPNINPSFSQIYPPNFVVPKMKSKRKPIQLFTETLKCGLTCKKSYMSMKRNQKGETELLGFFEVKDETDTTSSVTINFPLEKDCTNTEIRDELSESQSLGIVKDYSQITPVESCIRIQASIDRQVSEGYESNANSYQEEEAIKESDKGYNSVESFTGKQTLDRQVSEDCESNHSNNYQQEDDIIKESDDRNYKEVKPKAKTTIRKTNTTLKRMRAGLVKLNQMRGIIGVRNNNSGEHNEPVPKMRRIARKAPQKVCDKSSVEDERNISSAVTKTTTGNSSINKSCDEVTENSPNLSEHRKGEMTVKRTRKKSNSFSLGTAAECTIEEMQATVQNIERTTFKRPVCSTRQSLRLASKLQANINEPLADDFNHSPRTISDKTENVQTQQTEPQQEADHQENEVTEVAEVPRIVCEKMPSTKVEMHFDKLISFPNEDIVLDEVIAEFNGQCPEYIAEAILQRVAKDYHDPPTNKHAPAPLLTDIQRTMLGFMSKLQSTHCHEIYEHFLKLAEAHILKTVSLEEIGPVTRLYLAICKLQQNLHRMRKLCCDAFYFCGDLAVPFLFVVLTSWSEVLPHNADSEKEPLTRVLVQIVYMKDCNKPGYNLLPLRDLMIKFYGYPSERWDSDKLFEELLQRYLQRPIRSSDFALLLLCKNHPDKWVSEKIEKCLKPLVDAIPAENFKAALIIFIGNLSHRFSSKTQPDYLSGIRDWMRKLISAGDAPDVVKRSVFLSLKRLKKK